MATEQIKAALLKHRQEGNSYGTSGCAYPCSCGYREYGEDLDTAADLLAAHQAEAIDADLLDRIEILEARLKSARAVMADRHRELLELKGPCRAPGCRLHRAHSGPCAIAGGQP